MNYYTLMHSRLGEILRHGTIFVLFGIFFMMSGINISAAEEPVYFVSFSKAISDDKKEAEKHFKYYISRVAPAIEKHNIKITFFDVYHKSDKRNFEDVDLIAFGRAPSVVDLRKFFQMERKGTEHRHRKDTRLKLSDGFVLISGKPFIKGADGKRRLVRLTWLKDFGGATVVPYGEDDIAEEVREEIQTAMDELLESTAKERKYFRVKLEANLKDFIAMNAHNRQRYEKNQRGIITKDGWEVPDRIEIFSFGNYKGYFRDSSVRTIEGARYALVKKEVGLWLEQKDISYIFGSP